MNDIFGAFFAVIIVWYVVIIAQGILSYGTAYRLTKKGGDNGVALFGWTLLMGLASLVPGLGIYLWVRNREPKE